MDRQNDPAAKNARRDPVSSDQRLRELAHFVAAKIAGLNKGQQEGNTYSRASLARLRRSAAGDRQLWMLIGDDLFDDSLGNIGWNSDILGTPKPGNHCFDAALAALQFYALHRQSQEADVNTDDPYASFGRACSRIGSLSHSEPDDDEQQESEAGDSGPKAGVRRRLYAMERAVDFPSLLVQMRGLVQMLRTRDGHPIPLNYRILVEDLYYLQFPESRERVFRKWSQDFYSPHRNSDRKGDSTPA